MSVAFVDGQGTVVDLELEFDPQGLNVGRIHERLVVRTQHPSFPEIHVPLAANVASPRIELVRSKFVTWPSNAGTVIAVLSPSQHPPVAELSFVGDQRIQLDPSGTCFESGQPICAAFRLVGPAPTSAAILTGRVIANVNGYANEVPLQFLFQPTMEEPIP